MSKSVSWGKNVYGMMRYLKKVAAGHYQLKWQGDVVDIKKSPFHRSPVWDVDVNGDPRVNKPSFNAAVGWVANVWGEEQVRTTNLLNPGSVVMISRKNVGGCCDPSTERYHSM